MSGSKEVENTDIASVERLLRAYKYQLDAKKTAESEIRAIEELIFGIVRRNPEWLDERGSVNCDNGTILFSIKPKGNE